MEHRATKKGKSVQELMSNRQETKMHNYGIKKNIWQLNNSMFDRNNEEVEQEDDMVEAAPEAQQQQQQLQQQQQQQQQRRRQEPEEPVRTGIQARLKATISINDGCNFRHL